MKAPHELAVVVREFGRDALAVARWTVTGGLVGFTGMAVLGGLFAASLAALHGDASRMLAIQAWLALSGAIAGALMGGFAQWVDRSRPVREQDDCRIAHEYELPIAIARRLRSLPADADFVHGTRSAREYP